MPIIPVVKQDIWLPYLAGRKSDIGDARIIRCIPLKVMVIPVLGKEKKKKKLHEKHPLFFPSLSILYE